jgi:hypothetical protein
VKSSEVWLFSFQSHTVSLLLAALSSLKSPNYYNLGVVRYLLWWHINCSIMTKAGRQLPTKTYSDEIIIWDLLLATSPVGPKSFILFYFFVTVGWFYGSVGCCFLLVTLLLCNPCTRCTMWELLDSQSSPCAECQGAGNPMQGERGLSRTMGRTLLIWVQQRICTGHPSPTGYYRQNTPAVGPSAEGSNFWVQLGTLPHAIQEPCQGSRMQSVGSCCVINFGS